MKELANYKLLDFVRAASKHPKSAVAYTDGTYYPSMNQYGSGIVFVNESHLVTQYFKWNDPRYIQSGSVTGELFAALYAMEYATKLDIEVLVLIVDYAGIYDHAWYELGTKPVTKLYYTWIQHYETKLEIFAAKTNKQMAPVNHVLAEKLARDCACGKINSKIIYPLPWL